MNFSIIDNYSFSLTDLYTVTEKIIKKVSFAAFGMTVAVFLNTNPVSVQESDVELSSAFMSIPKSNDQWFDNALEGMERVASLPDNWDGYGASRVSEGVLANANTFLSNLNCLVAGNWNSLEITASPYGTVICDFMTKNGLVSVELSESKIGYFTDFVDGQNFATDGIDFIGNAIPQTLQDLLS